MRVEGATEENRKSHAVLRRKVNLAPQANNLGQLYLFAYMFPFYLSFTYRIRQGCRYYLSRSKLRELRSCGGNIDGSSGAFLVPPPFLNSWGTSSKRVNIREGAAEEIEVSLVVVEAVAASLAAAAAAAPAPVLEVSA